MIRRTRVRVPMYTSALLLLAGMGLAAQSTTPVTQSEMQSFVYLALAAAGASIVAAFWLLITFVTVRLEKSLDAHVARLEAMVQGFATVLREHHEDPLAHPRGSAARIDPLTAKIDSLAQVLATVHEQAAVLVSGQTTAVAELTEQDQRIGLIERDLHTLLAEHCLLHGEALKRRAGDPPGEDHRAERGK